MKRACEQNGWRFKARVVLACMALLAICYLFWAYVLTYAEFALDSDLALCSEEYGQSEQVQALQSEYPNVLIGGQARWSFFPPGWTCSFGLTHTQDEVIKGPGIARGIGTALSLGTLALYAFPPASRRMQRFRKQRGAR